VAGEAGVDEAGRRVREQAEAAEAGFAFQPPRQIIGQGDDLQRGAQDELAGV